MKHILLVIILAFNFQIVSAQVFEVKDIKLSGDNDKRINLVILGDGYQESELPQFEIDANSFIDDMFSQSPFAEYANYFNVYIIKVISNESGASHPSNASDESAYNVPTITVDNYFGTSYDSYDIHRLLYTENQAAISSVLANNFPEYDQAMILVNSPYYGGSGGEFPIASTGVDAGEIAIHEIGHSFSDLKDEYYPGDILAEEGINMTQETDPSAVKWTNWMNTNGVGIFPYANSGTAATWFRPHQLCKMRYLGYNFCNVCKEGIIEKIHNLVSPIDSYEPVNNMITNASFPIEFLLNTITPIPNTLETTWTLNSIEIENDVDMVSIIEDDLNSGANTLTAVVTDNASLLRVNNHETTHVYTVTWTIDNTLGTELITSERNNLSISMYPNPSSNLVNIEFKSSLISDLKVDIISVDGKKIKSVEFSNPEKNQLDISTLSPGIYVTKFYANNVLVSTKKLIKN